MNNKELKKLMTNLAKGKISKEEVDMVINKEKVAQNKPIKKFKGKKYTHKRKKSIKVREVKQ